MSQASSHAIRVTLLCTLPLVYLLSFISEPSAAIRATARRHHTVRSHSPPGTAPRRPRHPGEQGVSRRIAARLKRRTRSYPRRGAAARSLLRLSRDTGELRFAPVLVSHHVGSMFGVGAFVAQRSGDVARLVVGRATLLGADWVREEFTATRLHAATGSRYEWGPYDGVVNAERHAGLSVLGLLDYSNSWGLGDHGNVPHAAIARVSQDYARYAYAVARHYRGRINYWQIWNEPNLALFWHPSANPDDYAQLLTSAYRAIKRANSRARVVLAGTSGVDLNFILRVAARTRSFDIVSVHPYRLVPEPWLLEQIQSLRSLHRPIWFSEIGWAAGDGCTLCTSEEDQSRYLVRFYSLAAAAGVQRVFWYDLRDDNRAPESPEAHFGLLRRDLSGKPAFEAYNVLAHLLRGSTFDGGRAAGASGLYALRFHTGERSEAVLWNVGSHPRQVTLRWRSRMAVAFDELGDALGTVPVSHGQVAWTVSADGSPVYLVAAPSVERIGMPCALLHPPPSRVPTRVRHSPTGRVPARRAASAARKALPGGNRSATAHRRFRRNPRLSGDSVHRAAAHQRPGRSEHGLRRRRLPRRRLPTPTPLSTPMPSPTATVTQGPTPEAESGVTPSPSPSAQAEATPAPTAPATVQPEG